ncbi:MAG: biotin/lipoyl-containing protein [Gemmatimonadales bacterium]
MKYFVLVAGKRVEVELGPEGARVDGRPLDVTLRRADGSPVRGLVVGQETYRVVGERAAKGRWKVAMHGRSHEVEVVDERTMAIRALAGSGAAASGPRPVVAPMPGMIVKVEVSEGDTVRSGQGIVIVEAMKMENELRASGAGRVVRVHVRRGDAVTKDQILVELEALPADAAHGAVDDGRGSVSDPGEVGPK